MFLKVGSLEQQPQHHLGSCWKRKSRSDLLNENPWGDGQWDRQSRWFWWSLRITNLKLETEKVWLCTADTLPWNCHLSPASNGKCRKPGLDPGFEELEINTISRSLLRKKKKNREIWSKYSFTVKKITKLTKM